jgi:hypothetical protein
MFVFWQIQQLWFDLVVSGYGTQCGVFYKNKKIKNNRENAKEKVTAAFDGINGQ